MENKIRPIGNLTQKNRILSVPRRAQDVKVKEVKPDALSLFRSSTGGRRGVRTTLLLGGGLLVILWTQQQSDRIPGPARQSTSSSSIGLSSGGENSRAAAGTASSAARHIRLETVTVIAPRISERPVSALPLKEEIRSAANKATNAVFSAASSAGDPRPTGAAAPGDGRNADASRIGPPSPVGPSDSVTAAARPAAEADVSIEAPTPAPLGLSDSDAVRLTLTRYESAYENLDVPAAAKVWPSVDRRALGRAFATIRSQGMNLEQCDIHVIGDSATARCRGVIQIVPRVGHSTPFRSRQEWLFQMHKIASDWTIKNVTASRESRRDTVAESGTH